MMGEVSEMSGKIFIQMPDGIAENVHASGAAEALQNQLRSVMHLEPKELGALAFDGLFPSERDGNQPTREALEQVVACALAAWLKTYEGEG